MTDRVRSALQHAVVTGFFPSPPWFFPSKSYREASAVLYKLCRPKTIPQATLSHNLLTSNVMPEKKFTIR